MDKLNYLLGNNELLEVPKIVSEKLHSQKDINKLIEKIDTTEIEYFKHRGISEEVIKKYKLGISENGITDMYSILGMKSHPKMRDHKNIIPCFDEYNNLKFIVARNSKDTLLMEIKKHGILKAYQLTF